MQLFSNAIVELIYLWVNWVEMSEYEMLYLWVM